MDIQVLDNPITIADIKPGQEFTNSNGARYMRVQYEQRAHSFNALRMDGPYKGDLYTLSPLDAVTPCDPPASATCAFGELVTGDLFQGIKGPKHRYIKISDDEAWDLDDNRVLKGRSGCFETRVTPLKQVEPLKVMA